MLSLSLSLTLTLSLSQTTWEHLRGSRIYYLKIFPESYHPFDRGVAENLRSFLCLMGSSDSGSECYSGRGREGDAVAADQHERYTTDRCESSFGISCCSRYRARSGATIRLHECVARYIDSTSLLARLWSAAAAKLWPIVLCCTAAQRCCSDCAGGGFAQPGTGCAAVVTPGWRSSRPTMILWRLPAPPETAVPTESLFDNRFYSCC